MADRPDDTPPGTNAAPSSDAGLADELARDVAAHTPEADEDAVAVADELGSGATRTRSIPISPEAIQKSRPMRFIRETYRSEHTIYGTVLVSAVTAVGWRFETDEEVLGFLVGTVIVFWIAHLYAGVIARPMSPGPWWGSVRHAIGHAARNSVGMLIAMLLPALVLLTAVFGWVDEYVAYYIALWLGVAILAVLGFLNSARRGSSWPARIVGGLVTSAFGLVIIWLSALVH
jgi:hypothetical protein